MQCRGLNHPSPLLPWGKKKTKLHTHRKNKASNQLWQAHTFIGIALMCCSAWLITAKSYFCEGPMTKKLSANQLLIQHMLSYSVSGKRRALYLHRPNHLGTFQDTVISITYSGSNSLAKLDNKHITGSHIPVLSWACHHGPWNLAWATSGVTGLWLRLLSLWPKLGGSHSRGTRKL